MVKPKVEVAGSASKPIDLRDMMVERYEKRMRKVLKIDDNLKYNRDPNYGEIGSWLLLSIRGLETAVKLLVEKGCPIYIHTMYASAKFSWDYYEQEFACELWKNQVKQDSLKTPSLNEIKDRMRAYWKYCKYKKKLDFSVS